MVQVKINDTIFSAIVTGRTQDSDWDGRESKSITLSGDYVTVAGLFHDGMAWSIVETYRTKKTGDDGSPVLGEDGQPVFENRVDEYDNSEFCVLGDITVHTDGTCTVKMGKETDEEKLLLMLYGGEE